MPSLKSNPMAPVCMYIFIVRKRRAKTEEVYSEKVQNED